MDSEDKELKSLLASWHSEILYNLFREEDIAIEELKFIQYRHIVSLLKTYKMGVRIRFEHYLENWRNRLGIPLSHDNFEHTCNCKCEHKNPSTFDDNPSDTWTDNRESYNGFNGEVEPQIKIEEMLLDETPLLENPAPITIIPATKRKTTDVQNTTDSAGLVNAFDFFNEQCPHPLPEILRLSGTRGILITNYYEKHRKLTPELRTQLLQVICDFYESNQYHMSLANSHDIEREILEMFSTEHLQSYRNGNRGKLYIKRTNMKKKSIRTQVKLPKVDFVPKQEIIIQNMYENKCQGNNMNSTSSGGDQNNDIEADM